MVMTNNLALCQWYKDNSQNVAARGYCKGGATNNLEANNQAACTAAAGTWHVVPPFGIAAPECVTAPVTRDNHLGNTATGNEVRDGQPPPIARRPTAFSSSMPAAFSSST